MRKNVFEACVGQNEAYPGGGEVIYKGEAAGLQLAAVVQQPSPGDTQVVMLLANTENDQTLLRSAEPGLADPGKMRKNTTLMFAHRGFPLDDILHLPTQVAETLWRPHITTPNLVGIIAVRRAGMHQLTDVRLGPLYFNPT